MKKDRQRGCEARCLSFLSDFFQALLAVHVPQDPQHQGHRQGEGAHVRHRLGQLHPQLPPDMGQGQHRRDEEQPLPGYRPAQSMVYCGIYTEDGSKYPDLRDALEKLQLNDASLTFEPESSVALGFGFRCGFLGMLHMEIIQERLEREFNLDLVTTLPSVIYHVYKSDGTMVKVDNPHNYPDPGTIEHAEEPYVKVSIIAPNEFVGNIMPMCQERRGEFKDMQCPILVGAGKVSDEITQGGDAQLLQRLGPCLSDALDISHVGG